jgi:hypothetical protein
MMEKMKEMRKRQNASKGYKEWLKMSLVKAKQEHYVKKQMRKIEKKQKKEQQKIEERKKVEAEIQFKQWKLKKTRQERHERRVNQLKKLREEEQMMMLRERKRMMNQGADVMLAYSLNKNMIELESMRKRPKSARMGLRA